jgi:hypothetical protein
VISKEARPAAIRYERIGVSPSVTKYLCNVLSGRFLELQIRLTTTAAVNHHCA